jgi:hypothetical protein
VDLSHGDVDAFPPHPVAAETFVAAAGNRRTGRLHPVPGDAGGAPAPSGRLVVLTSAPFDPQYEFIITSGTQAH